jgi:hypothetical protein
MKKTGSAIKPNRTSLGREYLEGDVRIDRSNGTAPDLCRVVILRENLPDQNGSENGERQSPSDDVTCVATSLAVRACFLRHAFLTEPMSID